MHATDLVSLPSVLCWTAETVNIFHKVWALRKSGVSVYFTLDAGPNVFLIFEHIYRKGFEGSFSRNALCDTSFLMAVYFLSPMLYNFHQCFY